MTDTSHQLPDSPSTAEIAALTARLRELSTAGRNADPAARAEFIADKHDLLDRVAAAEGGAPGRERYPQPQDRHAALSRAEAADRLVVYGHSPARARELITDYLRETSERVGVPVYQWGLDQGDVEAIAGRHRLTAEDQVPPGEATAQADAEWATDDPIPYVLTDHRAGEIAGSDSRNLDETVVARLECPECGEDAVEQSPEVTVPYAAHGQQVPRYAHPDGEPLCPVVGPSGYEPAQPREVLAGSLDEETARRAQLSQWHADDTAAEAAGPAMDREGDGWADS